MVKFSLQEAASALNGTLVGADAKIMIEGITTDSRYVSADSLFVALVGEFFDGHRFAKAAVERGAICVLSHEDLGDIPHIRVENTKYAFLDLAKWYLEKFNVPVIGITGSAGKTTAKDMIAAVLSARFNVVKTEGNFNNEVGLPLTVFRIDHTTEIAVLEMGMNQFGEIHNLSRVGTPEVCIITNIGDAHIGNLGSREGILKAKSEIFNYADKDAIAILNGDDILLNKIQPNVREILYFGTRETDFCRFEKLEDFGLDGTSWKMIVGGESFTINLSLPGDYLAYNAAVAVAVGVHFGMSAEEITKAFADFRPSKNRMDIFEINEATFINDVYNASPPSMRAMIDSILSAKRRKICVFGDMLELGHKSSDYHEEIGKYAKDAGVDALFLLGEFASDYERGYNKEAGGEVYCFNDINTLTARLKEYVKNGDTILIKASRGMKFEQIVKELKEQ